MTIYLILTAAILVAEHYIPWQDMYSAATGGRRMHVTVYYVLGVAGFLGPLSLHLSATGYANLIPTVWLFAAVAGAGVVLPYALDWLRCQIHAARELKEQNELLRKQNAKSYRPE